MVTLSLVLNPRLSAGHVAIPVNVGDASRCSRCGRPVEKVAEIRGVASWPWRHDRYRRRGRTRQGPRLVGRRRIA